MPTTPQATELRRLRKLVAKQRAEIRDLRRECRAWVRGWQIMLRDARGATLDGFLDAIPLWHKRVKK